MLALAIGASPASAQSRERAPQRHGSYRQAQPPRQGVSRDVRVRSVRGPTACVAADVSCAPPAVRTASAGELTGGMSPRSGYVRSYSPSRSVRVARPRRLVCRPASLRAAAARRSRLPVARTLLSARPTGRTIGRTTRVRGSTSTTGIAGLSVQLHRLSLHLSGLRLRIWLGIWRIRMVRTARSVLW